MGRYALRSDEMTHELYIAYTHKGTIWCECKPGENPYKNDVLIKPGTFPIFILFFRQADLKLPFCPLLVDFFRATRLHLN